MALFGKLSKFQILDILAKFEEKLPNMGKKFFEPSKNFNPHDILSINVEAQNGSFPRFNRLYTRDSF